MRGKWVAVLMTALLLCMLTGCAWLRLGEPQGRPFRGSVVFKDFEGGFYGIVTEEGERLDPLHLPQEFKNKGLRVQGRYLLQEGAATIHMWGRPVQLLEIEPVGGNGSQ